LSPAGHEGIYTGGASATDKMTVISWNTVLLYPAGWTSDQLTYDASLRLPRGWTFGTSLQVASKSENEIKFAPVSLTMLVDSPIISGQYLKIVPLNQGENPPVEMDIAADTASALPINSAMCWQRSQQSWIIVQAAPGVTCKIRLMASPRCKPLPTSGSLGGVHSIITRKMC